MIWNYSRSTILYKHTATVASPRRPRLSLTHAPPAAALGLTRRHHFIYINMTKIHFLRRLYLHGVPLTPASDAAVEVRSQNSLKYHTIIYNLHLKYISTLTLHFASTQRQVLRYHNSRWVTMTSEPTHRPHRNLILRELLQWCRYLRPTGLMLKLHISL